MGFGGPHAGQSCTFPLPGDSIAWISGGTVPGWKRGLVTEQVSEKVKSVRISIVRKERSTLAFIILQEMIIFDGNILKRLCTIIKYNLPTVQSQELAYSKTLLSWMLQSDRPVEGHFLTNCYAAFTSEQEIAWELWYPPNLINLGGDGRLKERMFCIPCLK